MCIFLFSGTCAGSHASPIGFQLCSQAESIKSTATAAGTADLCMAWMERHEHGAELGAPAPPCSRCDCLLGRAASLRPILRAVLLRGLVDADFRKAKLSEEQLVVGASEKSYERLLGSDYVLTLSTCSQRCLEHSRSEALVLAHLLHKPLHDPSQHPQPQASNLTH